MLRMLCRRCFGLHIPVAYVEPRLHQWRRPGSTPERRRQPTSSIHDGWRGLAIEAPDIFAAQHAARASYVFHRHAAERRAELKMDIFRARLQPAQLSATSHR